MDTPFFDDVPQSIVTTIAKFLMKKDHDKTQRACINDVLKFGQTCKRFHEVSMSAEVWGKCDLGQLRNEVSTNNFIDVLASSYPNLVRARTWTGGDLVVGDLWRIPNLRRISSGLVERLYPSPNGSSVASSVKESRRSTDLRSVELLDVWPWAVAKFFDVFPAFPHLHTIFISLENKWGLHTDVPKPRDMPSVRNLAIVGDARCVDFVSACPNVSMLKVSTYSVSIDLAFLARVPCAATISTLITDITMYHNGKLLHLDAISNCPHLERLVIGNSWTTDELQALASLPNLKELKLSIHTSSEAQIVGFLASLQCTPHTLDIRLPISTVNLPELPRSFFSKLRTLILRRQILSSDTMLLLGQRIGDTLEVLSTNSSVHTPLLLSCCPRLSTLFLYFPQQAQVLVSLGFLPPTTKLVNLGIHQRDSDIGWVSAIPLAVQEALQHLEICTSDGERSKLHLAELVPPESSFASKIKVHTCLSVPHVYNVFPEIPNLQDSFPSQFSH